VSAVVSSLKVIFRHGYKFAKAGVMLLELQSDTVVQQELDLGDINMSEASDRGKLMSAVDALNHRFGKGSVHIASAGVGQDGSKAGGDCRQWAMKQLRRTPRYTTRLDEIPVARA
jgi:DNA polymerase V